MTMNEWMLLLPRARNRFWSETGKLTTSVDSNSSSSSTVIRASDPQSRGAGVQILLLPFQSLGSSVHSVHSALEISTWLNNQQSVQLFCQEAYKKTYLTQLTQNQGTGIIDR